MTMTNEKKDNLSTNNQLPTTNSIKPTTTNNNQEAWDFCFTHPARMVFLKKILTLLQPDKKAQVQNGANRSVSEEKKKLYRFEVWAILQNIFKN